MPALPLHWPRGDLHIELSNFSLRRASHSFTNAIERLGKRAPWAQSNSGNNANGIVAIPTVYQGLNSGPAPGTVVGIVLGSVAGFLLLIWLLWALSNGNGFIRTSQLEEEDVVIRRRSRSPRSRRSQARTEMTSRSPARRERVIRQERIVRDVPLPREPSRIRETIIVDGPRSERRVEGDDIVEVFEEHTDISEPAPPRRKSRRSSGYRRSDFSDFG